MELILLYTTLILYLLSLLVYWVYFFRKTPRAGFSALIILCLGGILHLCSLILRSNAIHYLPLTNSYETLSFLSFCIVLILIIIEIRYKIKVIGSFILPVVLLFFILALCMSKDIEPIQIIFRNKWFNVHIPFAFLSYANFASSFGISIVYLIQENQLKSHNIGKVYHALPSLELLDSINYKLLGLGLLSLSIGIITGSVWEREVFGSYWMWSPKEVWALLTALIYISWFHLRLFRGWRGKKSAFFSIAGFISMAFTYLGVNALFKGFHSFIK